MSWSLLRPQVSDPHQRRRVPTGAADLQGDTPFPVVGSQWGPTGVLLVVNSEWIPHLVPSSQAFVSGSLGTRGPLEGSRCPHQNAYLCTHTCVCMFTHMKRAAPLSSLPGHSSSHHTHACGIFRNSGWRILESVKAGLPTLCGSAPGAVGPGLVSSAGSRPRCSPGFSHPGVQADSCKEHSAPRSQCRGIWTGSLFCQTMVGTPLLGPVGTPGPHRCRASEVCLCLAHCPQGSGHACIAWE